MIRDSYNRKKRLLNATPIIHVNPILHHVQPPVHVPQQQVWKTQQDALVQPLNKGMTNFCEICGHRLVRVVKFCPRCGSSLN